MKPPRKTTTAALIVGVISIGSSIALSFASSAESNTCTPSWMEVFVGGNGIDSTVLSLISFDDGSGPALFAGGGFLHAGGVQVNGDRGALNRSIPYERLTRPEGPEGVSDEGSRKKEAAPT